ncbi:MAG: helix-hairpin-helix domain-containing protein [Bacteroidota bacterium]|nr:helix-hairpin-helix domain-containing protein [Bacteroidota bacterium]
MKLIEFLHKYFGFNKKERNGIIALCGLLIVLILVRVFLPSTSTEVKIDFVKLDTLAVQQKEKIEEKKYYSSERKDTTFSSHKNTSVKEAILSPFDPNTISAEEAAQLGFPTKTVNILINFRSKGGKFKNKEDLKKLYGLKEEFYKKLEPFILIQYEVKKGTTKPQYEPYVKKQPSIIELNTADSSQLVYLPMIGPGFTKRILKYRNALGGFYKVEQLKEVYGMVDSTYNAIKDKITVSPNLLKKINVNVAGLDEMKKHPYINYAIANSIVNYRNKHGLYKNIDDLKEVGTINDATLEKLKAYISF